MSTSCFRTGLYLAVLTSLTACGGGSSSSDNHDSQDLNALSLTVSNYQAMGQATVASAFYLGSTGGLAAGNPGGRLMLRQAQSADRPAASATTPFTLPCDPDGTLTVTFADTNNNNDFDVGESLAIEAKACKADGATSQGRIDLGMQALTGVYGGNSFSATLSMKLTAFGISQGDNSLQGDGSLTFKLSHTGAGVSEVGVAVPSLALAAKRGGQSFSSTLTDMQLSLRDETVNGSPRATLSYSGTLASSNFENKKVQVSTPQPLVIQGSDAYPSSGQLLVRGRSNSTLRITALNAVQARIELDADGDGNFETSSLKNWSEML